MINAFKIVIMQYNWTLKIKNVILEDIKHMNKKLFDVFKYKKNLNFQKML